MNPDLETKTSTDSGFFLAGDWGSSWLRLFLCQINGRGPARIMEQRSGSGIAKVKDPEAVLFEVAGNWLQTYKNLPIILSGMVGSNIGWKETPYQQCPMHVSAITQATTQFMCCGHLVMIVHGLNCTNLLKQPDLMRGEETQISGWYHTSATHQSGSHLLCLPGTHSKWALVRNGYIESFMTGFTGEMYDVLANHSMLLTQMKPGDIDRGEFQLGVATIQDATDVQLLHLLFSVRSRQIGDGKTPGQAASFLSGLLIGSDIKGALGLYAAEDVERLVNIIGDEQLAFCYALALESFRFQTRTFNTEEVCLEAYQVIANSLAVDKK